MAETVFLIRTQSDGQVRTLVLPVRSHETAAKKAVIKFHLDHGELVDVKVRGEPEAWETFQVRARRRRR